MCEVNREELVHWSLIDCSRCDGEKCHEPRSVLGYDFPSCPMSLLLQPSWQMVVRVYNAMQAQKGGLSNWPDGYLSYIEAGVTSLVSEINKKQSQELEKVRNG